MPFCRNCGREVRDTDKYCSACGSAQTSTANTAATVGAPTNAAPSGNLRVGHLIWSILNMVLFGGVLGLPLGIVALIMTVLASTAPTAKDEKQKTRIALVCNLLATTISVGLIVAFFKLYIGIVLLALSMV